jgi:phosphoglycerate dehydrogenase-like enzyme
LFRLMEMALLRRPTPEGERTLRYFFGEPIAAPLQAFTTMAAGLGLPEAVKATICQDGAELDRALPTADAVVVEATSLDAARIESCSHARLIQQFGRATEHIDLAAARRLGVPVANLVRISNMSAVDNVVALIMALARHLVPAHTAVRALRDPSLPPVFATDPPRNSFNWGKVRGLRIISNSTVGLVGLGEIAGVVAQRMRAMGMRVLYNKRTRLTPRQEAALGGIIYAPLDQLLAESDFVSLHVPYNPTTGNFADAAFFAKMKPGACIINTARGGVLDERALYDNLRSGHLGAAALDVYRYEPVPPDCPLLDLENVVWSPHTTGGEPEFMIPDSTAVLANIARALRGEALAGLVTDEAGE